MKSKFFCLFSLLLTGGFLSAQMPGMMTMQQASVPQGTTLGANTTSGAAGIALGNRVVMRGYVDFVLQNGNLDHETSPPNDSYAKNDSQFKTSSDVDFLFDLSPVTSELHLNANKTDGVGLEQVFARYSFNRDFNISFGRQLTTLGFESDEPTGLLSTSYGYVTDALMVHPMYNNLRTKYINEINNPLFTKDTRLRRNYVDGVRANFNNGRFGLSLGLHDGYWVDDDFNGDNIALDIAASIMIIPGLEARVGYAHQTIDTTLPEDEISQFNTWVSYKVGDLTLAFEYDNFDILGSELWDVMLLGNYQMSNWFGLTLKYAHEDLEINNFKIDSDRFSLALLFTLTDNFGLNLEYSHSEADYDSGDADADEISLQGLLTF